MNLSSSLEHALKQAVLNAEEYDHQFVTLEHLLLGLLEDDIVKNICDECHINITTLLHDITAFMRQNIPVHTNEFIDKEPQATNAFHRVLHRAAMHVQSSGRDEITSGDLLVSFFSEKESHAVYFLEKQGVTRYKVTSYLSKVKHSALPHNNADNVLPITNEPHDNMHDDESLTLDELEALATYCINISDKASQSKIDPIIGREHEIERMCQILCRRNKNNPLLIGEPGVGKTALAEGLAWKIEQGTIPSILNEAELYSLDLGAMIAGARYRGDFEERLKIVLSAIQKMPHIILFIDEIHNIVGAGATSGGAMDASNLLKPALANGSLRCIGATTYKEFRQYFEKDRALLRRFQKIDVKEPSIEETISIIKGIKHKYEAHHHVRYNNDAIDKAVQLSARYIHDRQLPDKAIDVLDEAGSSIQLKLSGKKIPKRPTLIKERDIEDIVANIARIPKRTLQQHDQTMLKNLTRNLKTLVFGQDEAINELSDAVIMARTGLRDNDKPIGCYLFTGPTGVGKTEVANQLARTLGMAMYRFDMSEYMERHAVSRLIGAPPGYVGFEQGGQLTDKIDQNPNAVILLDEIEKAHPDIFNILLQIMDNGMITDNNGKDINCRHAIIIMTSNVGADKMQKNAIGFTNERDVAGDTMNEVNKVFMPEFRNRLDHIITFNPLTLALMKPIVDKFIYQLEGQLSEKHISISLTKGARTFLAKNGFDPLMGARPLKRLIQHSIKKPLSHLMLGSTFKEGATIKISVHHNKKELTIDYTNP